MTMEGMNGYTRDLGGKMDDLKVATDLRTAADYLRTRGWNGLHQSLSLGDDGESRCLAGALYSAIGVDVYTDLECAIGDHLVALGFSRKAVWASPGGQPEYVATWNDAEGRTVEEVLDRLESTALALEVRALAANSAAASSKLAEPEVVHVEQ